MFDLVRRVGSHGNVAVIVGSRGAGKSVTGFWLLEAFRSTFPDRPTFAVGLPEDARKLLPKWIVLAREVEDVPNDSIVLLEESALSFKARRSFSEANLLLVDSIDIARHKRLSLVFISQSSALVDVNILRLADTVVIKEPSLLQVEMERRQVKRVMEEAAKALAKIPEAERKGKAYVIDSKYRGIVDTGLPSFWSDEISRLYRSYQVRQRQNPTGGTVDAISYFTTPETCDVGLCKSDMGSRYIHHWQRAKPKVVMDESGKMWLLGKVSVGPAGIEDFKGRDNDYSQLEPPSDARKIGRLVSLHVDGEELIVKDALLATDPHGERLYVIDENAPKAKP